MRFDRKIKYLDYRKNGDRVQGAGFVRFNVRDEICRLEICVSGLHLTDTFDKQVYLIGNGREECLSKIEIQNGNGTLELQLSADNLCNGLAYEEIQAIRIPIASECELYCKVLDNVKISTEEQEYLTEPEQEPCEEQKTELEEEPYKVNPIELEEEPYKVNPIELGEELCKLRMHGSSEKKCEMQAIEMEKELCKEQSDEQAEAVVERKQMSENKWMQLLAIYPHMNPFQDEREYLCVGPEDFVILNQRCYQLVHNSFLLHGYYNYRHLILTRLEDRGQVRYYIGVPGNFYEREKQVAMMFGFESFECKEEPADMGDYGYYMIRVEL